MQVKVSMVIACYNKEKHIAATLDSIIAQKWNNIELILVNDGSNDGTRAIIAGYEEKILKRGYKVVIIEQENQGVAMALHNGILRATGDYICMPDADDELFPDYVSTMAEWLSSHKDDQWVVCDCDRERWVRYESERVDEICDANCFKGLAERFILICNFGAVWMLMLRMDYLKQVEIIECLTFLKKPMTQEPQIWLPVILVNGKGAYIPRTLYKWNDIFNSLGKFIDDDKALAYSRFYRDLIVQVLKKFDVRDKKLYMLAEVRELLELVERAPNLAETACARLSELLIRNNYIKEPISREVSLGVGARSLYRWLWSEFIFYTAPAQIPPATGRIIGAGALGKRAKRLLPLLDNTDWQPTELWDKDGDGLTVKKPDFDSLDASDTLLVFPAATEVVNEVKSNLKGKSTRIFYWADIDDLIAEIRFPQFEHVRLK